MRTVSTQAHHHIDVCTANLLQYTALQHGMYLH